MLLGSKSLVYTKVLKIGKEWYQCVIHNGLYCSNCDLYNRGCPSLYDRIGSCTETSRSDNTAIIFKKLEKEGSPYYVHNLYDNKDILVQKYRLPMPDGFIKEYYPDYRTFQDWITFIAEIDNTKQFNIKEAKYKKLNMDKELVMPELRQRNSLYCDLKVYDVYAKDTDFIEVTEWTNGEGYDININDKPIISLTVGELNAIKSLTAMLDNNVCKK